MQFVISVTLDAAFASFPDCCRQPAVDMVIDEINHCTRLKLGGLGETWL